jgi:Immunity protein Imm1
MLVPRSRGDAGGTRRVRLRPLHSVRSVMARRSFMTSPAATAASPPAWFDGATELPAGSGIPLPLFEQVIAEFVSTGELPSGVPWIHA